jgi:tRNA-binding EMAP/Myf-like protein
MLSDIVNFMNLVVEEKFEKAYSEMGKAAFLPLRDHIEPDLANFQNEVIEHLPETILLALIVLQKRVKQAKSKNISSIGMMFHTDGGREIEELRNKSLSLKTYYVKIRKILTTKMDKTTPDNLKKYEHLNTIAQQIEQISLDF